MEESTKEPTENLKLSLKTAFWSRKKVRKPDKNELNIEMLEAETRYLRRKVLNFYALSFNLKI